MNDITKQEPTEAEQNGIIYQIRQKYGVTGDTDSYKLSHTPQYVKGGDLMISYFEARGGQRDRVMNFGAELIAQEYLLQRLTQTQADNMIAWATEHMGGNMADALEIALTAVATELDGKLPIRIRNAPEGAMIPIGNVMLTIETTIPDERYFSLVSYFETKLVRIWSPMTVATTSYYVRQDIIAALEQSDDNPEQEINFRFHDFGSRGVGGIEVAAFAGAGHLVSFMGTDTTVAVQAIEFAYGLKMAGYSIPASEHSTTTTHGRDGEVQLVKQMFDAYAKPGAIFATVIDSYDAINFIRNIVPQFKDRLIESGATWVLRPDSGDAIKTPVQIIIELDKIFGSIINKKGFKVLNNVRVIQGDGITPDQVPEIFNAVIAAGFSAANLAIGMGGGLLQKNNRDTHRFALKACAVRVNGVWQDVFKDPSVYDENWNRVETKSFKKSKAGRLELLWNSVTDEYRTVRLEEVAGYVHESNWERALTTVFENGYMTRATPFNEIRNRAGTIIT